jgi:ABC-type transporter Mla MlaB component
MTTSQPQTRKSAAFSVERKEGKAPGTVIFCLSGPFTARDMYGSLTPLALQNMLDFQSLPGEKPPILNILDFTGVPYMDSRGLGMLVNHHASCRGKGVRMIAAGVSPRILELFRLTKVDSIIPVFATVEEADIP